MRKIARNSSFFLLFLMHAHSGHASKDEFDGLPADQATKLDLSVHAFDQDVTLNLIPSVALTNPIGVAAAVTTVTILLIIDQLAQIGCIDSNCSLAHLKEKVFGVVVYEGDEYYKNWSNPKNLERKFPTTLAPQDALLQRHAYEKEMTSSLLTAKKMLENQEALKKIAWPHKACEKFLNFKLSVDPIYISENEELLLDDRCATELAHCRDSALVSIKQDIINLYHRFQSLGSELIYQVRKIIEDLKSFNIDSGLLVLAGYQIFLSDTHFADYELDDSDDFQGVSVGKFEIDDIYLMSMDNKTIMKLFLNCSHYCKLLEDFEHALDLNDQFFKQCSYLKSRFTFGQNKEVCKVEASSIIDFVKAKIAIKKEWAQACLRKIDAHFQNIGQSKIISHVAKSVKKASNARQKKRNKKIEQRLQSHDIETIDISDLLDFYQADSFEGQPMPSDSAAEIEMLIKESLN